MSVVAGSDCGAMPGKSALPAPVSEPAGPLAPSMERATWGPLRMALGIPDLGGTHKFRC